MSRLTHNPETYPNRNHSDEPDFHGVRTVANIGRPYHYFVVRTDDDRLSWLDSHPEGRIIVRGASTRHTAIGWAAILDRDHDGSYVVGADRREREPTEP